MSYEEKKQRREEAKVNRWFRDRKEFDLRHPEWTNKHRQVSDCYADVVI